MSASFAIHMHKSQDELTVYLACADIKLPPRAPEFVIVAGGMGASSEPLGSVELYDPGANAWVGAR